jgi:hypothetical protein
MIKKTTAAMSATMIRKAMTQKTMAIPNGCG